MANGRSTEEKYNGRGNGNGNGEDPFIEALERDAKSILAAEDDSSQPLPDETKKARMLALTVLLTISIQRKMVTRRECDRRHKSWFDWRWAAPAFPGVVSLVWMLLRLGGVLSGGG